MWTASLAYKEERTDGGVDLHVIFTDGNRKFQKRITFFDDFNLSDWVARELPSIEKLYQKVDQTVPGAIAPVKLPAPEVIAVAPNPTLVEVGKLRSLNQAFLLGLIDEATLDQQRNVVKSQPDFLAFL